MNRRALLKAMGLLAGGMVSPSLSRAVFAARSTARKPVKPVFDKLVRSQVEIVSELIIPTTDTPGAIAAGVPDFVEMMVGEWYSDTERAIFYQGLSELDGWCRTVQGVSFQQAAETQQIEALEEFERRSLQQAAELENTIEDAGQSTAEAPFFNKIRELVVVGYYTSKVGATQEHKLFVMSPEFDGDYPLEKTGGRQWAY